MAEIALTADRIIDLQKEWTVAWHEQSAQTMGDDLEELVRENHFMNFSLWHEEDKARRDDKGFKYVYDAKRKIDAYNQRRNDYIEKVDECLVEILDPPQEGVPMNSETPGQIIDRLSILALKEFHMWEETERQETSDAHRRKCEHSLAVIRMQIRELSAALGQLLYDAGRGTRSFRVYYQFKMYNDPSLNPELYRA